VKRVTAKTRLTEKDIQRALDRVPEASPFVLKRARHDAEFWGDEQLFRKLGDPKFILRPPLPPEETYRELDSRFTQAYAALKSSPEWTQLSGSESSYGIGRQQLYQRMAHNELTSFWVENFYRAGVRLMAGAPLSDMTTLLTANTDAVIAKAFEVGNFLLEKDYGKPSCEYCIVASGNYARGEWLPYSDTDLWFIWGGEGETTGKAAPSPYSSAIPDREYFGRLFEKVQSLLESTDAGNFHMRGPVTVKACERDWARVPGPVEIRERRNVLNARPIYVVGGIYGELMSVVAERVYDGRMADAFVSRIVDWKEFENGKALAVEEAAREAGQLKLSLNYSPGGSRMLLFLHHVSQILDGLPASEKVLKPRGVSYGLARLGELPRDNPFHASAAEVKKLLAAFNAVGTFCAKLRYRFTDEGRGWDLLDGERLEFLAGEFDTTPEDFIARVRGAWLDPVHKLWSKYSSRFKDSGRYVPWSEPPREIYERMYPTGRGLPLEETQVSRR